MLEKINKYNIEIKDEAIRANSQHLTNQLQKLIPMRENGEDWQKQLITVKIEIVGLNEFFIGSSFLSLIGKLEGLGIEETSFDEYRKTIFECISLLKEIER